MNTMKARLNMSFAVTGTALILLTGCVSSKKYHASQAELAKVRTDSSQLAQQVSSLNTNVQDLQNKNATLQHSLDNSNANLATQQKSLDYYQGYFKDQQAAMNTVSDSVRNALTQAGINADVQQNGNAIYVRLDENQLFKKNTVMVTPSGKQVLNGLAMIVKDQSNMNVTVATDDSAVAWTPTDNTSAGTMETPAPVHHRVHHHTAAATSGTASSGTGSGSGTGTGNSTASTTTTGGTGTAPAHKKVIHHHYSSESSTTMISGSGHMHNHAWALKQGRMVTVANHFLNNGVPKINVRLQQPPMNGTPQSTAIKLIIVPTIDNFNPGGRS